MADNEVMTRNEPATLGDALPAEIKRVNEEVIPEYVKILPECPMVALTIAAMLHQVDEAVKACAEGDVIKMIRAYKGLKELDV